MRSRRLAPAGSVTPAMKIYSTSSDFFTLKTLLVLTGIVLALFVFVS
jgi:hypothetical protein